MMSLMKPRKMVDLDGKSEAVLNEETNYVLNGRIWNWLRIGCIVCMAEDEADLQYQTLKNEDGECYCMTHGLLKPVSYVARRDWMIKIDGVVRTGTACRDQHIYIPVKYTPAEKAALLEQIFEEYKVLEDDIG